MLAVMRIMVVVSNIIMEKTITAKYQAFMIMIITIIIEVAIRMMVEESIKEK
jgi:hypothetical protein